MGAKQDVRIPRIFKQIDRQVHSGKPDDPDVGLLGLHQRFPISNSIMAWLLQEGVARSGNLGGTTGLPYLQSLAEGKIRQDLWIGDTVEGSECVTQKGKDV